jgi:hypothetical protein
MCPLRFLYEYFLYIQQSTGQSKLMRRIISLWVVFVVVLSYLGKVSAQDSVPNITFELDTARLEKWVLVIPSQWRGEIRGQVDNQAFRLPLTIQFEKPKRFEDNPVNLFVGTGDCAQVGDLGLFSASEFSSPVGGTVTLQYFSIKVEGSQLKAVLIDQHTAEAAAVNLFTGPNVSARQPGIMRDVCASLGSTEIFAFLRGTELTINLLSAESLMGSAKGSGISVVCNSTDIPYQAELTAKRVR